MCLTASESQLQFGVSGHHSLEGAGGLAALLPSRQQKRRPKAALLQNNAENGLQRRFNLEAPGL